MARERRSCSREYKVEAVKLVPQKGMSVAEAARSLGLHENLLRSWKQALALENSAPTSWARPTTGASNAKRPLPSCPTDATATVCRADPFQSEKPVTPCPLFLGNLSAAIVRTVVALWLLSTALLYWLGDFNTYADIGGREYVIARPDSPRRLAYCAGLGVACGIAVGAVVRAVGRNWVVRWLTLLIAFTAILYVAADLNMYVVGYGPEGQDWVKGRSQWGAERLLECGVLGGTAGAFGCFVLRVAVR